MGWSTPSSDQIPADVDRKLRRLSVVIAAQLPSDGAEARLALKYVTEIVQAYAAPAQVVPFPGGRPPPTSLPSGGTPSQSS